MLVGDFVLLMQWLGLNYALRFGFVFGSQSDVCTVMYKSAWWLILAMICAGLLVFMVDAKLIALTSHVHGEKEEDLNMLGGCGHCSGGCSTRWGHNVQVRCFSQRVFCLTLLRFLCLLHKDCFFVCLFVCLFACLFGWLVGWLVGWFICLFV